jgi:hypothetical protein
MKIRDYSKGIQWQHEKEYRLLDMYKVFNELNQSPKLSTEKQIMALKKFF